MRRRLMRRGLRRRRCRRRGGGAGRAGGALRAGGRWRRCWPFRRSLSLLLVRADTAFQDEALYLWAGHLQWAHWLHGAAVPPFAYYFSGAPVIYPPLGALADCRRGPGRRPDPVAGVHAGGNNAAVGHRRAAVRAPGRVLRRRAVRRPGPDAAPGLVRHLRRHVGIPDRAGRLVRDPGRPAGRGDRLDARGGSRAGAGQRRGVLLGPVRPGRARARAAHRAAIRRQARRPAGRDAADRRGRAAHRGHPDRRQRLPHRDRADNPDPRGRHRHPADRARRFLVLGRPHRRPGRVRRHHQLGQPPRTRPDRPARGPGHRRDRRPAGTGEPAHRRLAEQARRPRRLVRRHRRRLRHRQIHRHRARRAAPAPSSAGPA